MPAEAQWISALVNSGGVLALVVILLRQQSEFRRSMEKRWDRLSDVLSAFVEILSRIEVHVGINPRETPPRSVQIQVRRRRKVEDTDPRDDDRNDDT